MPVTRLVVPALSTLTAFTRISQPYSLNTLIRSTGYKIRPPKPTPYKLQTTKAYDKIASSIHNPVKAELFVERRLGTIPTIVLGGFVPNSTEQVFLMRGFFLRRGSVYYVNYPQGSFSLDLLCAQLDDLVEEITTRYHQYPVIFGVSFGAGIILEWIKRQSAEKTNKLISGIVLVSPVACLGDVLDTTLAKPNTLLGRALKPYFENKSGVDQQGVEKARAIFTKMFEAGAQNKECIAAVMTAAEVRVLKDKVLNTIQSINMQGSSERVYALSEMKALSLFTDQKALPLTEAPVLILYAEKESAVLCENSPTRRALESHLLEYFPQGSIQIVSGGSTPVQHASLIFHYYQFLQPLVLFYRKLRAHKVKAAA
jgi:pimeloyl-ACP methyl ester carboxylesterase